ncbi:MAG: adenylate kinase [Ruminiclostridium sp.]|nr:adenylate kinase [Ruminiclostridium sp.]
MVIIITGASHTGKTVLAQKLLEKYKFPYISSDHIKMGLIRSGYTSLTPEQDIELIGYLWPVIREMIKTVIENDQNLIIEGCYIPFDWRKDFDEEYLRSIRFICLSLSDRYIDSHYEEIKNHSSDIENRVDDTYCTIGNLKKDNQYYIQGFTKSGEDIITIDDNYSETIEALL